MWFQFSTSIKPEINANNFTQDKIGTQSKRQDNFGNQPKGHYREQVDDIPELDSAMEAARGEPPPRQSRASRNAGSVEKSTNVIVNNNSSILSASKTSRGRTNSTTKKSKGNGEYTTPVAIRMKEESGNSSEEENDSANRLSNPKRVSIQNSKFYNSDSSLDNKC